MCLFYRYICIYIYVHTYICKHVEWFLKYVPLLQNTVSFIGLFCKRDLCFLSYVHTYMINVGQHVECIYVYIHIYIHTYTYLYIFIYTCIYIYIHTYICKHVEWFLKYVPLLQNTVSFIGLFCKRDLCFLGAY